MRGRHASMFLALALGCLLARSAGAQPVGSYLVGDGPAYDTNPPVATCLEACAQLFGGAAADYSCSTSATEVDHQAWLDGWGDPWSFCTDVPGPENFSAGTTYDCGEAGCSYSAYVNDHTCMMTNYCWSDGVVDPPTGVCGDGTVDVNETCDDGNTADGDCCSAHCQVEPSGAACSDGDACNGAETCDGAGACVAGDPLDCDDGDPCTVSSCDPESGCQAAGTGPAEMCEEASQALLTFDARKKTLLYGWEGTAAMSQFGDPVASDATAICLYDGAGELLGSLAVEAGGMCGQKPCWKAYSSGFSYGDWAGSAHGVRWLKLKAGASGRGKISLGAWGDDVGALGLASGPAAPLLAQVVNGAGGCFETSFKASEQKVWRGKLTAVKTKRHRHDHHHHSHR